MAPRREVLTTTLDKNTRSTAASTRIEICGGIASGKTTLASILPRDRFRPNLEDFRSNPFWKAFYDDPIGSAFETELTFFLQHYHGIKVPHSQSELMACDYSLVLDLAYARVTLKGRRLEIFEAVFQEAWQELGPPDLLVYLRCDAETELFRIKKRAREVEKSIDLGYLTALNASLESVISQFRSSLQVNEIDSAKRDFANDSSTKIAVGEEIRQAFQRR
jgi:deoxyguanosine kinase